MPRNGLKKEKRMAHQHKFIMKLILSSLSVPMMIIWSVEGLESFILLLALALSLTLFLTGVYKKFMIGMTDQRLIIVTFDMTRRVRKIRSIEFDQIKSFDSVTINNSFWAIDLLDGSTIKFAIDKKEEENPGQAENAQKIDDFLMGLNEPAYTSA